MTRQELEEAIALTEARKEDAWKVVEGHRDDFQAATLHYHELCLHAAELRRIRDGREPMRLDPDPIEVAAEHGATPTVDLSEEDTVK